MALSLEKLLEDGFTRDDIMKLADSGAFGSNEADKGEPDKNEPDKGEPDKNEPDKNEPGNLPMDPNAAMLAMMGKMMEQQNALIVQLMNNNKVENKPPEENPEDKARKFSDEQLVGALQSLNILKPGDKIDIGSAVEKNIEDKILGKLGAMVGFTVDKENNKEG